MEKRLMNNIGLKILAFFVAFMLWIMVVNIDDPVTHKTFSDIPVSVINEEVLANAHQPQTYQILRYRLMLQLTVLKNGMTAPRQIPVIFKLSWRMRRLSGFRLSRLQQGQFGTDSCLAKYRRCRKRYRSAGRSQLLPRLAG